MKNQPQLKAENPTEQKILDHLTENASDTLIEKINTGKKTLAGALAFAASEAQTMAGGSGSICIDDATVYGWIIHYFEEDNIEEAKPAKKEKFKIPTTAKPKPAKEPAKKEAKKETATKNGMIYLELFK